MRKVSVIGLGYVGLPLAVAFGEIQNTIAFDIDETRIQELKKGYDRTGEIYKGELIKSDLTLTNDPFILKEADFHIIAVPTPVDGNKQPILGMLRGASNILGMVLKQGDMVVYESTVYPGVTEEICIPILEAMSGLKAGVDFKVGYSPERVAPSTGSTFRTLNKLVAGQDEVALEIAMSVYGRVMGDKAIPVSSIKVAEASKILENVQRDVNIALMNQVSILFNKMGIDTHEVIEAANTKWNFHKFVPGLVGGHCIGVDPYYLISLGDELGVDLGLLKKAREANEFMVPHIISECKRLLKEQGKPFEDSVITVLGLTFKENCPDTRNSKAIELMNQLRDEGAWVHGYDPIADIGRDGPFVRSDAVIIAVAHNEFKENQFILKTIVQEGTILMDVKGFFREDSFKGTTYWKM